VGGFRTAGDRRRARELPSARYRQGPANMGLHTGLPRRWAPTASFVDAGDVVIVAVFSDVHANRLALDVFLAQVEGKVDAYLCLGDSVNYGPWNDECLERILGLPNITMLEGNHERLFRGDDEVSDEIPLVRAFFEASHASFRRTDLIDGLPTSCELGPFLCVHTIDDRRVFADTDVEVARDHLIGHSHHQFLVTRNGYTIANPGSVGQ